MAIPSEISSIRCCLLVAYSALPTREPARTYGTSPLGVRPGAHPVCRNGREDRRARVGARRTNPRTRVILMGRLFPGWRGRSQAARPRWGRHRSDLLCFASWRDIISPRGSFGQWVAPNTLASLCIRGVRPLLSSQAPTNRMTAGDSPRHKD